MKYLFLLLILAPFSIKSQQLLPEKDGKVIYEQVDSVPGVLKTELYSRAKIWLVKEFNSSKAVIELDDKDAGQIIGKGSFKYVYTVMLTTGYWRCSFTLQIDCRDNKARIKIYDISSKSVGESTAEDFNKYASHSQKHIKAINDGLESTLASFKKGVLIQSSDSF